MRPIIFIVISLALIGQSCSSVKRSTSRVKSKHESEIVSSNDSSASRVSDSGKVVKSDSGSVKKIEKTDENKVVVTLDPKGADSSGGEIIIDYPPPGQKPKPVKIKVPKNTISVEVYDRRQENKSDSVYNNKSDSVSLVKVNQIDVNKEEKSVDKSEETSVNKSMRRTAILSGVGAIFLLVLLIIWIRKRNKEKKSLL